MSTRSRIGIENQDGTISSIYCHHDGYISHNGKILQESYLDREKIQQLIELGDISSLDHELDLVIAYHRDRNEKLSPAVINSSLESFKESDFEDYGYIFSLENKWIIFK
jgi:hypothetical protein